MPLKQRAFELEPQYWTMLEEIRKRDNLSSDAFTLRKCIEALHQKKEEPKALTLDLVLQATLGDALYQRHLEFLKKRQKQEEKLEDVFRNFVRSSGIDITKEEWKERIKETSKPDPFQISEPSPCHYRVITEQGECYCDLKKIPLEVCIKRQERYLFMGRKCTPLAGRKEFKEAPQKPSSNRRFCKRDQHWFNKGEKNCLECKWLPKECFVKKEVLRDQEIKGRDHPEAKIPLKGADF